jgi:MoaA/NifB/PqqE/SkfB family radical SAM enzyme
LYQKTLYTVEVLEDGQLMIPEPLTGQFGLTAGTKVVLDAREGGIRILPPVTHLAKVYIEPTNTCDLGCRTCMRNVWDEPLGFMNEATFQRVLQGLEASSPRPGVFFGGFGEPLSHPQIVQMIQQVKALGCRVELISNGINLSPQMAEALVNADLDLLWVSIDGARPESYADVRLGANLPTVLANLKHLRTLMMRRHRILPELGIAFVAMRRNIQDLPELLRLGSRLGVSHFSVSNVISHTQELAAEELYRRSIYAGAYQASSGVPHINFPRMDASEDAVKALVEVLSDRYKVNLAGGELGSSVNRCPFIHKNSTSIRWDGGVSPCLPLLHSHKSHLDQRLRESREFLVGSVLEKDLLALWMDPAYLALRERLRDFDFSPCTFCNSCEMPDSNLEDCFGSSAPACGGCLWAQGIIQCP